MGVSTVEAGRQALERGEFRQAVWEATSIKDPPQKKKIAKVIINKEIKWFLLIFSKLARGTYTVPIFGLRDQWQERSMIYFDHFQTELEECTEILSQMVNRLYLRTPRRRIVEQARAVQRKRLEFITAISKGLVPPETPPATRKGKKKKKSSGETAEDVRNCIFFFFFTLQ